MSLFDKIRDDVCKNLEKTALKSETATSIQSRAEQLVAEQIANFREVAKKMEQQSVAQQDKVFTAPPISQSMWAYSTMTNPMMFPDWNAPKKPSIDSDVLSKLQAANPRKIEFQERIPDYTECLVGWRGWGVKNKKLTALGYGTVWPIKEIMVAKCGDEDDEDEEHEAPAVDCTCGVWSFKTLDNLVAAIGSRYSSVKVIGQVSLWGRVIETENGYRAEKAYPKELWLLDSSLTELGFLYDVPVRTVQ